MSNKNSKATIEESIREILNKEPKMTIEKAIEVFEDGGFWDYLSDYEDGSPGRYASLELQEAITYREHDVNNKNPGSTRDAQRFVTGSDGSVYYTDDHYSTFTKLK